MSPELPEAVEIALKVVDVLDGLGIRYHVGGSHASSVHGIPRHTQGIALVVQLGVDQVEAFVARLRGDFYVDADAARRAIQACESFNLIHRNSAIKLDLFIVGDSPFDREEFARGQVIVLSGGTERTMRVKTAEDTILRKLLWYREGGEVSEHQWSDVLGVVRVQRDRLDRNYIARWARELDVEDLVQRVLVP